MRIEFTTFIACRQVPLCDAHRKRALRVFATHKEYRTSGERLRIVKGVGSISIFTCSCARPPCSSCRASTAYTSPLSEVVVAVITTLSCRPGIGKDAEHLLIPEGVWIILSWPSAYLQFNEPRKGGGARTVQYADTEQTENVSRSVLMVSLS